MSIVSLGSSSSFIRYKFDSPFTIVSQGPGFFGGDIDRLKIEPGNILVGNEGHGTIKFLGVFDQFNWTVPNPETWHGFTFGIRNSQSLSENGFHKVTIAESQVLSDVNFGNTVDAIEDKNYPPQILSDGPVSVVANERYRYRPTAVDPDGDKLEFDLVVAPQNMVIDNETGSIHWTPTHRRQVRMMLYFASKMEMEGLT